MCRASAGRISRLRAVGRKIDMLPVATPNRIRLRYTGPGEVGNFSAFQMVNKDIILKISFSGIYNVLSIRRESRCPILKTPEFIFQQQLAFHGFEIHQAQFFPSADVYRFRQVLVENDIAVICLIGSQLFGRSGAVGRQGKPIQVTVPGLVIQQSFIVAEPFNAHHALKLLAGGLCLDKFPLDITDE